MQKTKTKGKNKIKHFTDLKAWQVNYELTKKIYNLTKTFPKTEKYGLTDQLRRASSSITANIAEGWGRYHFADKVNFYYNARGSNCEVQNFLILAKDMKYINKKRYNEMNNLAYRGYKILNGLIKSINKLKDSS